MSIGKFILSFVIVIGCGTISCARIEKVVDPRKKERNEITTKNYEKDGLSFAHPDNWRVTDDIVNSGPRLVNVEDSDNSLFVITLLPPNGDVDLDAYAENFTTNVSKNMPVGNVSEPKKSIVNRTIDNKDHDGIQYKYSIVLLGQNVPHTANFFVVELRKSTAIIMIQAPDEDWKAADKEFQVIFDSLRFD